MVACVFTACSNNNVQRHEIQLSNDNFKEFLDYDVTIQKVVSGSSVRKDLYEIKGVLIFAYYKDVSITFYAEYSNTDSMGTNTFYKGYYTVKLNAAGNYSFYTNDEALLKAINCNHYTNSTEISLTIKSVSGSVIFNI